jgi:hypothetical protein
MKTKTIGTLLIAGLIVLSAMVVFATPVMAYTDEEFENAPPIVELELYDEEVYPAPPEGETRDDPRWYGQVTKAGTEDPVPGLSVKLYKKAWFFGWYLRFLGSDTTDANGDYSITNRLVWPEGQYYLRISDGAITETYPRYLYWRIGYNDYTWMDHPEYNFRVWTYLWNQNTDIPEFSTIAIPAIAVLGLFLFFNKRKRRKN